MSAWLSWMADDLIRWRLLLGFVWFITTGAVTLLLTARSPLWVRIPAALLLGSLVWLVLGVYIAKLAGVH